MKNNSTSNIKHLTSILITGGAGFIGSNFIPYFLEKYPNYRIVCLDKLTYAGNLNNLMTDVKCKMLDEGKNNLTFNIKHLTSYKNLITFVTDRPGHDKRYAIDATKIENELEWRADEDFESGIVKTINWYMENYNA